VGSISDRGYRDEMPQAKNKRKGKAESHLVGVKYNGKGGGRKGKNVNYVRN